MFFILRWNRFSFVQPLDWIGVDRNARHNSNDKHVNYAYAQVAQRLSGGSYKLRCKMKEHRKSLMNEMDQRYWPHTF